MQLCDHLWTLLYNIIMRILERSGSLFGAWSIKEMNYKWLHFAFLKSTPIHQLKTLMLRLQLIKKVFCENILNFSFVNLKYKVKYIVKEEKKFYVLKILILKKNKTNVLHYNILYSVLNFYAINNARYTRS